MSNQPFMQLYVGDYLADTMDLSTEEHGAYLLLLMTMWKHGAELPNDPKKLARIARLSPAKFKRAWGTISRFFEEGETTISQKRLKKEHEKAIKKSEERAKAGAKGGAAKALKTKEPHLANATDLPPVLLKHGQKSEPDIDDDEDSAGEVLTFREQILEAIGADLSGLVGASGKMLGTQADMAEVSAWLKLPGITEAAILEEIKLVMGRKNGGPPGSFRYFTPAIQQLSGALSRPDLKPISGGSDDNRTRPHHRKSVSQGRGDGPDPALEQIARLAGLG